MPVKIPKGTLRRPHPSEQNTIYWMWVEAESIRHFFSRDWFYRASAAEVERIMPTADIWVWEDADTAKIAGFLAMKGDEILGLYVDYSFSGRGIAGKMLNFAKQGRDTLTIWLFEKNMRHVRLFYRNYFKREAELTDSEFAEMKYRLVWRRR